MLKDYLIFALIFDPKWWGKGLCSTLDKVYPDSGISLQEACPILWSFKPKVNYHGGAYWFNPLDRGVRIKLLVKCIWITLNGESKFMATKK